MGRFQSDAVQRPVILTTNDGTTWAGANCDSSWYGPNKGGWSFDCAGGEDPGLEPSERSARQRTAAFSYIRRNLGGLPGVVAARLGRTLDFYHLPSVIAPDVGDERPRWAVWLGIGVFWTTAAMALVGWRRVRGVHRWLLGTPMVVVVFTTVMFYGGHRIRSPAEVSLALLAALGCQAGCSRSQSPFLAEPDGGPVGGT